jgi:hypothetical protein
VTFDAAIALTIDDRPLEPDWVTLGCFWPSSARSCS